MAAILACGDLNEYSVSSALAVSVFQASALLETCLADAGKFLMVMCDSVQRYDFVRMTF